MTIPIVMVLIDMVLKPWLESVKQSVETSIRCRNPDLKKKTRCQNLRGCQNAWYESGKQGVETLSGCQNLDWKWKARCWNLVGVLKPRQSRRKIVNKESQPWRSVKILT